VKDVKFNNVSSADILATSIVDQPTSKLQGFWRVSTLEFQGYPGLQSALNKFNTTYYTCNTLDL
jgi:hypothetical protein